MGYEVPGRSGIEAPELAVGTMALVQDRGC